MRKICLAISLVIIATSSSAQSSMEEQDALPEKEITAEQVVDFLTRTRVSRGACIYSNFGTFVCKDDVTKEWCDRQPNSDFGAGDTCP